MKKTALVFFCCLNVLLSLAQKQIIVDEYAEMRSIAGNFSTLQVSGNIQVIFTQSEQTAIAISAPDASLRRAINTVVVGDQLMISYSGESNWGKGSKRAVVYVASGSIIQIKLSGASELKIAGTWRAGHSTLYLSGESEITGTILADTLLMQLSGASDAYLSGQANHLTISSSGASDLKAKKLQVNTCLARASGASDIEVTVENELEATATGASQIWYWGHAVITTSHAKGASIISKKDN